MRTEIRSLTEQDLEPAARLLAERHRADRCRSAALSERFEDRAAVRPLLAAELAKPLTEGVVATRDGELVGYLIASVSLPPPGAWYAGFGPRRAGEISYLGYAASGREAGETYRELYAALAPFLLRNGAFSHAIEINADDETARDAWYSLGFGQTFTLAVRDTTPVEAEDRTAAAGVSIHQAGTEDIDVVMTLGDHLARHHNASPVFLPYLPEETEPGLRAYQLELLAKPENAHWIAYRDGEAVAMQTFHGQDFAELARPERSVYLFLGVTAPEARGGGLGTTVLRHAMDWAREAGYERCTLHFLSANIAAARFWLGSGFRPLTQRLVRRIDERLAWAHAGVRSSRSPLTGPA